MLLLYYSLLWWIISAEEMFARDGESMVQRKSRIKGNVAFLLHFIVSWNIYTNLYAHKIFCQEIKP